MWIVNLPLIPWLFWPIAILWSGYQACVGYQYGLFIFDSNRERNWHTRRVRRWSYGVPHGAFYFVCTLSGFVAWKVANQILTSGQIGNWSSVAAGTGAILVALTLVAIAGVSGILPRIFYLGNRPA